MWNIDHTKGVMLRSPLFLHSNPSLRRSRIPLLRTHRFLTHRITCYSLTRRTTAVVQPVTQYDSL